MPRNAMSAKNPPQSKNHFKTASSKVAGANWEGRAPRQFPVLNLSLETKTSI